MDSTLHSHLAGLYIQERMEEATGARRAREARSASKTEPRRARRPWRRRATKLRPVRPA